MPRFAANLSFMYQEHAFLDRFSAAAADGFRAVEFLFPYAFEPAQIMEALRASGLTLALFNLPPGDWDAGERGVAALPGREEEFDQGVTRALVYAQATGCQRLHAMAGVFSDASPDEAARRCYVSNLRRAAARLAPHGITLLIEPINTRDMPGYYLNYQQQACDVVEEVGAPNLKIQMDLYHCQIMEGDLLRKIERQIEHIGHVQIAGVPERHEPDEGEVNYPWLLSRLDALGYAGFVGCEYRPRSGTSEGLNWFQIYRDTPD